MREDLIERLRTELVSANKHGDPDLAALLRDTLAALEAAREDAERYRWLRQIPDNMRADHDYNPENGGWDAPIYWHGLNKPGDELQGPDLDAAIDQARGKAGQGVGK